MLDPSTERWKQVDAIFAAALDLTPQERYGFVLARCAGEPELEAVVIRLLEASESAERFLEQPLLTLGDDLWNSAPAEREALPQTGGRRIGPYRIVRRLSRGGMGTVYLAERADGQFEQRAAIKLLRRGLDTEDILARFLAERQILASLDHPHIAHLIGGGATEDGRPYLVMQYVEGNRITEYCDARQLTIEDRLELFLQVAQAVQHAHENGVLHRDLKPSNILVDDGGRARLLDFGIGKLLSDAGDGPHTRTGARLLTPEYASPEQRAGGAVTAVSDVYQLGMLLYELLAGDRPDRGRGRTGVDPDVAGHDPADVLAPSRFVARAARRRAAHGASADAGATARVRGTDPVKLRRTLRGDLDLIVLKALRPEPEERYGSVNALIDDLDRYCKGLPVRARRRTLGYRTRKFAGRHRAALAAGAGLLVGLLGVAAIVPGARSGWGSAAAITAPRPVAVGQIRAYDPEAAAWAGSVADMLATSLSRIPELEVLSPLRMAELVVQIEATGDTVAAAVRAARIGGAAELVEGTLHRVATGYRIDLRWVELGSGRIRRTISVAAPDLFELAERATTRFARAAGLAPPAGLLAAVTTRSSIAYRFYEEGVRAYYAGDGAGARAFLHKAVSEDSTFALASFFLGLSTPEHAPRVEHMNRALRSTQYATERDGLLIRAMWAHEFWEPEFAALADSLVARYPAEPEGHYLLGRARVMEGDYHGAITHLERVVAMDSLGLDQSSPRCRACDALREMITAYLYADSVGAAERVARRWTEAQPESARPWHFLAWTLWRQDRFDEAMAARRAAAARRVGDPGDQVYPGVVAVRAEDFAAAERLLRDRVRHGPPRVRALALWWLTVSLRHEGRLDEALETARAYGDAVAPGVSDLTARGPEAQVLLDAGRYAEAAALFDSISAQPWSHLTPARNASRHLRGLSQVASTRAAAGDRQALAALADTMAILGEQSGLMTYRLLHHYPRGLQLLAEGRPEEAARELRRVVLPPVGSYPRPKMALADALLELQRPHEAVALLQATLRGPIAGPGAYATRTEMHELLGRAWESAGRADSAAVHYGRVLSAWERADPSLHARRDAVRQRLLKLSGSNPSSPTTPPWPAPPPSSSVSTRR